MFRVDYRSRHRLAAATRAKGYQGLFGVVVYEALKAEPTALIRELSSKGLLK